MIFTTKQIEEDIIENFNKKYKAFGNFVNSKGLWDDCISALRDATLMNNIIFCNDIHNIPPVHTFLKVKSLKNDLTVQEKEQVFKVSTFTKIKIFDTDAEMLLLKEAKDSTNYYGDLEIESQKEIKRYIKLNFNDDNINKETSKSNNVINISIGRFGYLFSFYTLYRYVLPEFKEEVCLILLECIDKTAIKANSKKHYSKVYYLIQNLKELDKKERVIYVKKKLLDIW